jgi:CHAT domain-containing protein/Tfp pilus assembly protein PilF
MSFSLRVMSILLFAIVSFHSSDAQESSIQEAKQLTAQVEDLHGQGRYEQAIPLAQRALAIREKALGPEHPDTAESLDDLAGLYRATAAYSKAEPLYQRALAIREKVLGPEHNDTAESLNNLGLLYRDTGAYAKAEPLFKRALAINEKTPGHKQSDTAIILSNLGSLYILTGDYAKAEPLYQRALAIREKVLGPEHNDTASSLDDLGLLYSETGAYAKAEPLFERALAISEKTLGPEHPYTAIILSNLSSLYVDTGAYAKAEPLYQRALAIREKVLGPEHPDTAKSLDDLGVLYLNTGRYGRAQPLLERALVIHEKKLGPEHPHTAIALNNLAELYRTMGTYSKAEPLYERALAIKEKTLGPDDPGTARSLNNLAELYRDTGAYDKAESLFGRSLEIKEKALGPEHPEVATTLENLAGVYKATGDYANAEPLYRRALSIREETVGPENTETATALNNLGLLYLNSGDYAKAKPLLEHALAIREKADGPEHPSTAIALNNLADLYLDTGASAKATSLLLRSLAIDEKMLGPDHPATADALDNLGAVYEAIGADEKAQPLFEQAQSILERNTARFLLFGSEARKQAYLRRRADRTYANVSFSVAQPTARSAALGLTGVLQYKGRVLDAMSDSLAQLRRSFAPEDSALFAQLSEVAQELSTLTFGRSEDLSVEAIRQRMDALAAQQEKLEAELSLRNGVFRQTVTPITLANVRKTLPPDAVLVEWYRYRPFDPKANQDTRGRPFRYVAYVLTRSSAPAVIDLGPAQPIEALVADFRSALSDPASTYVKEVAVKLSEKLIEPLHLRWTERSRLLLSPDGVLSLVPFAALVDKRGEYLARHFEVTYLTSGRDLLRMAGETPSRGSAVVLADPDYGRSVSEVAAVDTHVERARSVDLDRSGLTFAQLPGTADEARALQSLLRLDARNVLTGDRATEARLRELHGPRILHMATHGFFLNDREVAALKPVEFGTETLPPFGENPLLRSGLALAGANARHSGASDDGILTAAEAAQLDLLGTQLVVLSACETGVGTVQTGEGVYGLRRALVLAGAQTQLVSLWKVADAATQELMLDYYRRLLRGAGRSGALRDAQIAMLANPGRRHPYYWAAFIAIGNWTPLAAR